MSKDKKTVTLGLVEVMQAYVKCMQSGAAGPPTMDELQFCGQVHACIERATQLLIKGDSN